MSGVKVSLSGLKEQLSRLDEVPKKINRAALMALNDTGETLRAQILKEMGETVNIKRQVLRDRVRITKARRIADAVRIWALKRGLVLSHFPHKQMYRTRKKGKRVRAGIRVNVGGTEKYLPGAFIVPSMGSSKTDGLIARRTGKDRLPIEVLYGPSPSQILNTRLPDYREEGERVLRREVLRQLERADL